MAGLRPSLSQFIYFSCQYVFMWLRKILTLQKVNLLYEEVRLNKYFFLVMAIQRLTLLIINMYLLVLYSGWKPVLIAMSISSGGGLILDQAVTKFSGIAVFQPLFNGVGGNLVAVQASRISTYLHLNVSIQSFKAYFYILIVYRLIN